MPSASKHLPPPPLLPAGRDPRQHPSSLPPLRLQPEARPASTLLAASPRGASARLKKPPPVALHPLLHRPHLKQKPPRVPHRPPSASQPPRPLPSSVPATSPLTCAAAAMLVPKLTPHPLPPATLLAGPPADLAARARPPHPRRAADTRPPAAVPTDAAALAAGESRNLDAMMMEQQQPVAVFE